MLSPTFATNGDLVLHDGSFDKVFHNVTFPAPTYYCPPQPPSQLLGRYRPPPRPGPVYRNDLSLAGPLEHFAQMQVSRMWRGVLTRRRLRNEETYRHVLRRRAIMIQCWWRQLRALWRRRMLHNLREHWAVERRETYVSDRLKGYGVMMTWQRKRFESAVVIVQRVYRWYMNRRQRAFLEPDDPTVPAEVPFPLQRKRKRYFPWRPKVERPIPVEAAETKAGSPHARLVGSPTPRRPRLSLHSNPASRIPVPPPMEEVKEINDRMREREAQWANVLAQPEVIDRGVWKRDGLKENDFDHNAGMIQRLVRYKWAGLDKMTRGVTTEYFVKKICIIQRCFHVSRTLRHIERRRRAVENRAAQKNEAYAKMKLEDIEEEMAWQSVLLNNAARTIQMTYAWYKYYKCKADPFRFSLSQENVKSAPSESQTPPPIPPFHLLDQHIEREHALRNAARSKMAREMEEASQARHRSKMRFVPKAVIVVRGESQFDPKVDTPKEMTPKGETPFAASTEDPFRELDDGRGSKSTAPEASVATRGAKPTMPEAVKHSNGGSVTSALCKPSAINAELCRDAEGSAKGSSKSSNRSVPNTPGVTFKDDNGKSDGKSRSKRDVKETEETQEYPSEEKVASTGEYPTDDPNMQQEPAKEDDQSADNGDEEIQNDANEL